MSLEKKVRFLSALLIVSALTFSTTSKADEKQWDYILEVNPAARAAVLGTTIGLNGIICSIMATVEKRDILKDTGQCMAGGAIQYIGMETGMYALPVLPGFSLRVTETGTSIIENTLAGREPFEKLHYSLFGPGLLEINTKKKKADVFWRIAPVIGFNYNIAKGNKFDVLNTLSYQTITFTAKAEKINNGTSANLLGYAIGNVMTHDPKYEHTIAHEFNHTLQYVRYRPAQNFVPEKISFLEKKSPSKDW